MTDDALERALLARRFGAGKTIDEKMTEYGFDPAADRLNVLPNPNGSLDPRDWTAPQWVYDAAKAVALPGHVAQGGSWTPEDVTEAALNVGMLGGVAGTASAPRGALAMGSARHPAEALPMDEASRMARARDLGFVYARRSRNPESPINDGVGYAMFKRTDDPELELEKLSSYGPNGWLAADDGAVDAADLMKDFTRSIYRRGLHKDYQTTAASLARDAAPRDIVDSAGSWDAPDIVEALWEDVLEPKGILSIRTPDGLIKFDSAGLRRRDAAFDPAQRDSADLLAANRGALPPATGAASGEGEEDLRRRLLANYLAGGA